MEASFEGHMMKGSRCTGAALFPVRTSEVSSSQARGTHRRPDGPAEIFSVGVRELPAQDLQPAARCAPGEEPQRGLSFQEIFESSMKNRDGWCRPCEPKTTCVED